MGSFICIHQFYLLIIAAHEFPKLQTVSYVKSPIATDYYNGNAWFASSDAQRYAHTH